MDLLPILASELRPLPSSSQFIMSNRAAATILGMMPENLVIMSLSVRIVEATQFHLKACVVILHPIFRLVMDAVLKALIQGRPCRTPTKIVVVVLRRGNKKSSLNLIHNPMPLKWLYSILLLFWQRRRKSLLPRRKSARGQTPRSLKKKVHQRE